MEPADQPNPGATRRALALLAFFVIFGVTAIVIVWGFMMPEPEPPRAQPGVQQGPRGRLEAREALATLQTSFPDEHREFLSRYGEGGASSTEALDHIRGFLTDQRAVLAAAPDAELVEVARAQAEAMRALRTSDLVACARVVDRGFGGVEYYAPEVIAGVDRAAAIELRALRRGLDSPVPDRGPLTREVAQAFLERMEAISPRLVRLPTDRQDLLSGPDKCDLVTAMYQAIGEMPPPQAATYMAMLIRDVDERWVVPRPGLNPG